MSRQILIAGCGQLGIALGARLAAAGDSVIGVRRSVAKMPSGLPAIAADLTRPQSLRALPTEFDWVVYCPTPQQRNEPAYRQIFVEGLAHLQAHLQGQVRYLFVSSTAVYGQNDGSWVDESSPCNPRGFNGEVLLEAEQLALAHANSCVLRLAGLYGPGRERLLRKALTGGPCQSQPPYWTNRIHVDDAAAAIAHIMSISQSRRCYIGVDDAPVPQYEVMAWLAQQLGGPKPEAVNGEDANKRLSNKRLRHSGFAFSYPDYRAGYGPILAAFRQSVSPQ